MEDPNSQSNLPPDRTGPYTLQVFYHLEQAQSGHGITHQDYGQYGNYCTAKLARLRRVKPVCALLVHNPKYSHDSGSGGNKRKNAFAKRDEMDPKSIPHANIFWNLLFQAERAWSQACALQQQQQQQRTGFALATSSKKQKSKHGHVQRRLNKAVKFAAALSELASRDDGTPCDEQSAKECEAYLSWMKGNAELEHKHYAAAFRGYKQSLVLLLELADRVSNNAPSSNEDYTQMLALQDIWISRAETIIRPLLRYCQYEAKGELSREDLQLPSAEGMMAETNSETGDIVLSFRGKDVSLDKDASYKELAVLYLKMESSLKSPESLLWNSSTEGGAKDVESKFLQLLSDLDDAIALAQAEYNRYDNLPAGPNVNFKRDQLLALMGYFRYQKLNIWRHQQEARIVQLEKDGSDPEVMVHTYDALLQNGQSLADLLSGGTGTSLVEGLEDDVLWLEAQAHLVRIRAFRCFHLARQYESTPSLGASPKQVLCLLNHSRRLTGRAKEEIAAIDDEPDEGNDVSRIERYLSELDDLSDKTVVMACRVKAARLLAKVGGVSGSLKSSRPLWLRLDELDAGEGVTALADHPPLPLPMPCKGTFFDIAWQHIGHFPVESIEKVLAENEPKKPAGPSFLGWLTGNS